MVKRWQKREDVLTLSWRRRERGERTWPAGGHMTRPMGRCAPETASAALRSDDGSYSISCLWHVLTPPRSVSTFKNTTCSCSLYCISPVTTSVTKCMTALILCCRFFFFILSPTTAEISFCKELFINESVPRLIQMYCRNNFTKDEDCVLFPFFFFSFFCKWM